MKTTLPICLTALMVFSSITSSAQLPDNYNPYTGNPLGQAQGFNIITKSNFTLKGGQIQGPIAMGGDLLLNGNATVATSHSGYYPTTRNNDNDNYSMVVGGRVNFSGGGSSNVNRGLMRLANTTGTHLFEADCNGTATNFRVKPYSGNCHTDFNNPRGIHLQRQQTAASTTSAHGLDFTNAYSWFSQLSQSIAYYGGSSMTVTEVVKLSMPGTLNPKVNLVANKINFIQMSATQLTNLASQGSLTFGGIPSSSTPVVFNITVPASYTWTIPSIAGLADSSYHYIVWHLSNGTSQHTLTITGGNALPGTLLAPLANLNKTSSNSINGQVIVNSISMDAGQVNYYPFLSRMAPFEPTPLAVKLTSFNGSLAGNKATLQWSVAQNEESLYYDVEKSTDGRSFTTLARVQTTGKAGSESYTQTDASGSTGYYRLKMVSRKNDIAYSGIIRLQATAGTVWQAELLQNPVTSSLPLRLTSDKAGTATIQLYSLTGARLMTRNMTVQKGSTTFTLSLDQDLPKGTYLLEVVANGERSLVKMMK